MAKKVRRAFAKFMQYPPRNPGILSVSDSIRGNAILDNRDKNGQRIEPVKRPITADEAGALADEFGKML